MVLSEISSSPLDLNVPTPIYNDVGVSPASDLITLPKAEIEAIFEASSRQDAILAEHLSNLNAIVHQDPSLPVIDSSLPTNLSPLLGANETVSYLNSPAPSISSPSPSEMADFSLRAPINEPLPASLPSSPNSSY